MLLNSWLYSIPYIFVFILLCFLFEREIRGSFYAKHVAFFILLLFLGLRGFVGSDFASYYLFFKELPTLWDFKRIETSFKFEPGFVLYSSIIKSIFPNYFFWVFINTFIDLYIFNWLFKRFSSSVVLSWIIFISIIGLSIEFNLFRNVKSILLFLVSIPYLKERKPIPYLLLNLLGCLFHQSSFIYLPLYFILTKKLPISLLWGSFILVNVMMFTHFSFTNIIINQITPLLGFGTGIEKFIRYISTGENYGLSIGYIERTITFIVFTLSLNKLRTQNDYNNIFYNCFFFYYILFYLFIDIKVFTERFPILFAFSYWILYPNFLSIFTKKGNIIIITTSILLLCFLKLISSNTTIMSMYDNLLWGIYSFSERMKIFNRFMY